MQPPVGFLLLTHANPSQILRLTERLEYLFEAPPVVVHHDFYQCALPEPEFPRCVSFVRPHIQTTWARFSCVEATILGFEAFIDRPKCPDWIVLLSGADYPIKPASRVVRDLKTGGFDAHIGCTLIDKNNLKSGWQRKCFMRYCTSQLWVPSITRDFRVRRRMIQAWIPFYTQGHVPFQKGFRCFAGPQWFCISRRAAEYIVNYHVHESALREHYRPIYFPEESYFQTILANAPDIKVSQKDWRFIEMGAIHPKTLTWTDLPELITTDAHFARKFDPAVDSKILDELDRIVGAQPKWMKR